jgi:hypothetical protein
MLLATCISGSYTLGSTTSDNHIRRIVWEMANENRNRSKAVIMFLLDHNIKYLFLNYVDTLIFGTP